MDRAQSEKKSGYEPPSVKELGSVAELTQGSTGASTDLLTSGSL